MAVKLGNGKWAIKEDKLLAYNDNSGRFFNKEFDFSRGTSATYVAKDGLIKSTTGDIPRIDFSDTSKGALLLEPQSTNSFIYSQDFTNSYWQHNAEITVTASSELTPTGQLDANLIEYNGSGYSFIRAYMSAPSTAATLSVFAKKGNWRYIGLRNYDQSTPPYSVFDFDTNTFVNVSSGQTATFEILNNGWYRLKVSNTSPSSNTIAGFAITDASGNELNPTGGQVANVHLFGTQLEALSFSTSYIPTSGSTVTRNAEVCNNSGSAQDFNDSEGVIYMEVNGLGNDGTLRYFGLSNSGSSDNRALFLFDSNENRVRAIVSSGGTKYVDFYYAVTDITEFHKIALKYKENDFALWIDGAERQIDTNGLTPIGLNNFSFDLSGNGIFHGKVRELQVFTTALTDQELQQLTT